MEYWYTQSKQYRGNRKGAGDHHRHRRHQVKVVYPHGKGVATSGSYIRGAHIYNPHAPKQALEDIVSITVVGPDVLAADLAATAAFAMGKQGMAFIEQLPELEGYAIDRSVVATMTSGFSDYTAPPIER